VPISGESAGDPTHSPTQAIAATQAGVIQGNRGVHAGRVWLPDAYAARQIHQLARIAFCLSHPSQMCKTADMLNLARLLSKTANLP
jgi:hypothetical protein